MADAEAAREPHPVRLSVEGDLGRRRLTVLVRLVLVIPHLLWMGLWGFVAFLVAFFAWLIALVLGRLPLALHNFFAAYVRYVTHVYAYLNLAADPYPSFDGRDSYPVDVAIDGPRRQRRLSVLFRGLLAIPALLMVGALVGTPTGTRTGVNGGAAISSGAGVLHVAALLGWFAILARGRMPLGLRDAAAYVLGYGAQFWAYAFLLTDRYPNSDPLAMLGALPVRDDPVSLDVSGDLRRSRLTVFFRLPLSVPHLLWLQLWGILVLPVVIVSWLTLLLAARQPARLRRFLARYVRYQLHVYAFLYMTGNPFPGFTGREGSYPVEVRIADAERQPRWKVGLRLLLVIPAALMGSAYGVVVLVTGLLGWFAALATARMPRGLRNVAALGLRYQAQLSAYALLLTDAYPYSGPCTNPESATDSTASAPPTEPLPVASPTSPLPELGL